MPPLLPLLPVVAAVTSAGVGVAELGLSIANSGGGSAPKPPTPTPTALTPAENQRQVASASQAAPNIQALTGGALSPEYWASMLQQITGGTPGNVQEAINQAFGLTAGGGGGAGGGGLTGSPERFEGMFGQNKTPQLPVGGNITEQIFNDNFQGFSGGGTA